MIELEHAVDDINALRRTKYVVGVRLVLMDHKGVGHSACYLNYCATLLCPMHASSVNLSSLLSP